MYLARILFTNDIARLSELQDVSEISRFSWISHHYIRVFNIELIYGYSIIYLILRFSIMEQSKVVTEIQFPRLIDVLNSIIETTKSNLGC